MRPRLGGALLLLLAFGLGVAAGALGLSAYQARWGWNAPGPGPRHSQHMLRRLDQELTLTTAQREQVEAILRETGQEFTRLRDEVRPRFRDIRASARARIREVLDPAQREKFDALNARLDDRMHRRPGGPGGPSGGG